MRRVAALGVALLLAPAAWGAAPAAHVYRVARVVDGDTVDLTNGAKVRLVQIDTPEVYFGLECCRCTTATMFLAMSRMAG